MRFRVIALFLLAIISTSCEYFNLKKKSDLQVVDTIIDFSSVDVSPSFQVCDSIIEKIAKTNCFRTTIHAHISESLAKHSMEVRKPIDEAIQIEVVISNKGKVSIINITSSDLVKQMLPDLDSLLEGSIQTMPRLLPARKRGIPVSTQYQIPIQIVVK